MIDFEIAPKKYHIECSYNEALLYCFQLEIDGKKGWQLPTRREADFGRVEICWWIDDEAVNLQDYFITIPVRDITND
jgi:hypothetical protein